MNQNDQIVSVSFFYFEGIKKRWWAFQQMGRALMHLSSIRDVQFSKLLGSGGGKGFGLHPNFGVYSLLCVWEGAQEASDFFQNASLFSELKSHSKEHWTVFLKTIMAHGRWDGQEPFQMDPSLPKEGPIGVLTRATIHNKHVWKFWREVAPLRRNLGNEPGLLFSIGVGELPLLQQATFSLWESEEQMKEFAYKHGEHHKVIRKTREMGWYKEDLFARFVAVGSFGNWQRTQHLNAQIPQQLESITDGIKL